ncbi:40S ribosomal protein S2 [Microtus ochrogaster]|uniref:Small ribosomal subunit protein uS5 n=1 Tax=Microtus ochrogaster TaxID=79684 RepID=A0A8J6FYL0_MICOH|nr:40S ribosomal protein S2 [Microtus ochrogaster]
MRNNYLRLGSTGTWKNDPQRPRTNYTNERKRWVEKFRPADQVQGFRRYWGLQWSSRSWCQVLQGGSHCHPRAIILAKLSIVPVRRDYLGNKIGKPHTVPCKVTGHCGSVLVCLIPAPRGTGIVSAPVPKKLLMMAGINDCYTSARGCTATLGNFAKATFDDISKTYSYLTPDLWKETVFTKSPYLEFTDHLVKTHTRVSVQRTQAPAVTIT